MRIVKRIEEKPNSIFWVIFLLVLSIFMLVFVYMTYSSINQVIKGSTRESIFLLIISFCLLLFSTIAFVYLLKRIIIKKDINGKREDEHSFTMWKYMALVFPFLITVGTFGVCYYYGSWPSWWMYGGNILMWIVIISMIKWTSAQK